MHTRTVHRLYEKALDIGQPVVALIPTQPALPPVDPVNVARLMSPAEGYIIEALAVGLSDMYDNPGDDARLRQIINDLETAHAALLREEA